jgi:outer membrane translocation and assembly module TamA
MLSFQKGKNNSIIFSGTFRLALFYVPLFFIFQSCFTTRYLDPEKGETLLVANHIEFEKTSKEKVKNKATLTEQLSQRLQQRPNRKLFGIRRPHFYFISLDSIDKTKFGLASDRTMRRILGEEPVFIDTLLAKRTAELMTTFLQNKGFFKAQVDYSVKTNKKNTKAEVTYHVKSNGQYLIDTLIYESKDTVIQEILDSLADDSFLKPGEPIDISLYEKEVSRITKYLINNGYANFYPQYINNLEAFDSSDANLNAQLSLEILPPPNRKSHQVFYIGDIYVFQNFNPSIRDLPKPDTLYNGIYFTSGGKSFKVKPKSLKNSIALKTGELYRFEDVEATRRQLGALGVFTTPTIRIEADTLNPDRLNFFIYLTSNKKWELEVSGDVSYTVRTLLGTNLIGLSVSPSVRNRNLFRGAELGVIGLDLGIEVAPFNKTNKINSLDLRGQTDIFFPRFVEYPKVWKSLTKTKLISDSFYNKVKKNGISRVSASYNLLRLLGNYDLHFSNMSFGHDIQFSPSKRVSINQAGVDLLIPNIVPESAFGTLIDSQLFLQRSFSKQFMTGFLFRDISFTYDESFLGYNSYWFFRAYFDVSGLEVMGLNALANGIFGTDSDWEIGGVNLSHYIKLELDGRRYWKFGPKRTLIARLNTGVVRPYYNSTDVPYVKQFYVGGPNSLRGWYARGLGPGSFVEDLTLDTRNRNRFYQAADFKIEFNLEYRTFLLRPFGFFNLHGAVFIDGGNIWTLKYDELRRGSQFSFKTVTDDVGIVKNNFVNTIAVSGGVGLRWDVSYFTLRTDFGTPLKNNYPDPKRNDTYFADFKNWGINDIVWSLSLGYPF